LKEKERERERERERGKNERIENKCNKNNKKK